MIRTVAMLAFWSRRASVGSRCLLSLDIPHWRHSFSLSRGHGRGLDWGLAWPESGYEPLDSTGSIPSAPTFSCPTMCRTSIRRSCCR